MSFYIIRILVLGLVMDLPITIFLLRKYQSGRIARWVAPYVTVLAYLISALAWIQFYGTDPRFQGQGALGLALFFALGISGSIVRLFIGIGVSIVRYKNTPRTLK